MTIPTIHRNGTGQDQLLEQLTDASAALREAISKLYEAYPNARDYYSQGPDAILRALREHDDRVTRVKAVRQEIEELAIAVADGGHQHART